MPIPEIIESGRYRFVRKTWRKTETWEVVPFIDDDEAVRRGYALGGQGRDMRDLSFAEREELLSILLKSPRDLTDFESDRAALLSSRTGFTTFLGPIDIDINEESPHYDQEKSKWKAYEYAKRLAYYAPEVGLGNPNWFSVSWAGGFHADLIAPEDISDPDLLHAARILVNRLALRTEVPLYLSQPSYTIRQKSKRTDVYVDDSVLNKNADARGGLWRLPGKPKPHGKKKTLVDILADGCPQLDAPKNYSPVDRDALLEALETYKASIVPKRPEPPKQLVERKPREIIDIRTSDLAPTDLSFISSHGDLLQIWNTPDANRSFRDYNLALHSVQHGADKDQALRLVRAMPGSKATQDRRGADYDRSIFNSVKRTLSRSNCAPSIYEGFIKPLSFEQEHRQVIDRAINLATDWKIRNKLISTLTCGEATIYSEETDDGAKAIEGIHRCERVTCAYCEPRRIYLQVTEASKSWPDKVIAIDLRVDDSIDGGRKAYAELKATIKGCFKAGKARKIISKLRSFRAPGKVLVLLADVTKFDVLKAELGGRVSLLTRDECIRELLNTLYTRFNRVADYIRAGNASALASDPWVGHVVSFSSGRKAKKSLPWLSKENIRLKAKKEAQRFRGKAGISDENHRFSLVDNVTGKRLKTSASPIGSHEASQILYRSRKADLPENEWYIPRQARAPD